MNKKLFIVWALGTTVLVGWAFWMGLVTDVVATITRDQRNKAWQDAVRPLLIRKLGTSDSEIVKNPTPYYVEKLSDPSYQWPLFP